MRGKMLSLGIAIVVLLCSAIVPSAKAASMWSQTYGGVNWDQACSLVETPDGGYTLAGTTSSFGAGQDDFWLVKTDAFGNMEWNKTYGGTWQDYAYSLIVTSDGGYAITGWTMSFGAGSNDFWLVKTDAVGNMEWNQTYGGTGVDEAYSLVATSDGGYALAGYTTSFGAGNGDFWLVKTDEAGNMLWDQTYGGTGADAAYSLITTPDEGYAIAGFNNEDFWLVKTDALGNMLWNQTYGGTGADAAYSLITTPDEGYAIAGSWNMSDSSDAWNGDFWLVKTDESGNMEWNQTYGGPDEDYAYSLVATSDGGYTLAGVTGWLSSGGSDFWLVKTDAVGNMEWNQTYGGTGYERAYSLVAASDGGYPVAGYTTSFGAGNGDFWLVKTDELGVVPEYSSLLVPMLVLAATGFIMINKKRLHYKH